MMLYCARCQDATLSMSAPSVALSMRTDTVRFIP